LPAYALYYTGKEIITYGITGKADQMKYKNTCEGRFVKRPNRFVAQVELDGREETVHVKNTGRCKELFLPGVPVILAGSDNPARKTRYDLVTVYKASIGWINIDSQAPNKVFGEWLRSGACGDFFPDITYIKPEYTFGRSRLDYYIEYAGKKALVEIKGVTLERDRTAYFPDAPTERGVKHIKELTQAAASEYECFLVFVIQMNDIHKVLPNDDTHPEFGDALREAAASGVNILYLSCEVGADTLEAVSAAYGNETILSE